MFVKNYRIWHDEDMIAYTITVGLFGRHFTLLITVRPSFHIIWTLSEKLSDWIPEEGPLKKRGGKLI